MKTHKSILSRCEITDSAERTSALFHEHLSVRIKTRLERRLLLNSGLRNDSRGIAMHSENLRIDPDDHDDKIPNAFCVFILTPIVSYLKQWRLLKKSTSWLGRF